MEPTLRISTVNDVGSVDVCFFVLSNNKGIAPSDSPTVDDKSTRVLIHQVMAVEMVKTAMNIVRSVFCLFCLIIERLHL